MAKTRPGKQDLDYYTINGTNKIVRAGDCVQMRAENGMTPYIARVEKIEADKNNNVSVRVRWFYRPEDSGAGRKVFHGARELFLSDHFDVQSAHTIEGKCNVHTYEKYSKLKTVGPDDYYWRFEYIAATGEYIPDRIKVYCKCEMPCNPDVLMVQCDKCKEWYHPDCVGLTADETMRMEVYVCSDCATAGATGGLLAQAPALTPSASTQSPLMNDQAEEPSQREAQGG